MKFVLAWTPKANGTFEENIEAIESSQRLLADWQPDPSGTPSEWVMRCDGNGGFAVLESDDPEALYRDLATWTPWLTFELFPVLDVGTSTPRLIEAMGVARSAL